MKNLSKFPILFIVVAFSACRSHKAVEVSNYTSNDSCIVQTNLGISSHINTETTESISSYIAKDFMEFSDGAGEIRIHSTGDVSIKGLKSACIMSRDYHKQSATTVALNDNVNANSYKKSANETAAEAKDISIIPIGSSIRLKIFSFMTITAIIFLAMRYFKKLWLNSKN